VKNGKIEAVYERETPDPETLRAEPIEAAGKTILPGLIDASVKLERDGGLERKTVADKGEARRQAHRALAAHLYCGVTSVGATGELEWVREVRDSTRTGVQLGAEVFLSDLRRHDLEHPGDPPQVTAVADMARGGAPFLPALAAVEGLSLLASRSPEALERSLVQQVVPKAVLVATRRKLVSLPAAATDNSLLKIRTENLRRAYRDGLRLALGTGSGDDLVFHGPSIHRELQLWVQAGVSPSEALRAATFAAARFLGAADRIGLIRKGYDADLLVVDGNPLQDISATERISMVVFKGERLVRAELLDLE
jgi:imidazolonepropionase-like amidohydrolase